MRDRPRFTTENTDGYTTADLQRLNLRYEGAIERHFATEDDETADERESRPKFVLDAIAETVLSDFDTEQSQPATPAPRIRPSLTRGTTAEAR